MLVLGHELERERISASGDTIGLSVFGTLNGTVCWKWSVMSRGYDDISLTPQASLAIRACGCVPLVSIIAVGITALDVKPAPIGIDDDLTVDIGAAVSSLASAAFPVHLGMNLALLGTDQLS